MYLTEEMRGIHIRWDSVFTELRRMRNSQPPGVVCHASNVLKTLCPPTDEQLLDAVRVQLRTELPNQYRASLGVVGGQTLLAYGSESYGLLSNYQYMALPVAMYWWNQIGRVVRLNKFGNEERVTDTLLPIAMMSSYSHPASIHDIVRDFHVLGLPGSDYAGQVLQLDLDSGIPQLQVLSPSFEEYFEDRTTLFLNSLRLEST